jgi:hypothetical protein
MVPDAPAHRRGNRAIDDLDTNPVALGDSRLHKGIDPFGQCQVDLFKGSLGQAVVMCLEVPIVNHIRGQVIPRRQSRNRPDNSWHRPGIGVHGSRCDRFPCGASKAEGLLRLLAEDVPTGRTPLEMWPPDERSLVLPAEAPQGVQCEVFSVRRRRKDAGIAWQRVLETFIEFTVGHDHGAGNYNQRRTEALYAKYSPPNLLSKYRSSLGITTLVMRATAATSVTISHRLSTQAARPSCRRENDT